MYSLQKYAVPFVFALILCIIFSCQSSGTSGKKLDRETFRAVLTDAFLAEAYAQEASTYKNFNAATLMNQRVYAYIYQKHGIDSAVFSNTFDHYLRQPDEFREILQQVNDTLNILLASAPEGDPLPPVPQTDSIRSDTALAEDAMNRFRLMEKIRKGQGQAGEKTN